MRRGPTRQTASEPSPGARPSWRWPPTATAGTKLAPRGTAGYAVFAEPIHALHAARAAIDGHTRVAIDVGDLEYGADEPIGPPLVRAARLVAVANPGQALCSPAAHEALTASGVGGWAAASLGRFDIVGLDGAVDVYQLVGHGFGDDFPPLQLDRLPPLLPRGAERSVPGFELRALIGAGELGEVHRAYQPTMGREVAVRIFDPAVVAESAVRPPLRDGRAADQPRRAPRRGAAVRLLA